MDEARIAKLLAPFLIRLPGRDPTKEANELISLSPSQLQCISIYIDLLLRWNARINLTAIRTQEQIVTRHFGESFFLARHLFEAPQSSRPSHTERGLASEHVSSPSGSTMSSRSPES